jgi:predicted nucleotidyltransferase
MTKLRINTVKSFENLEGRVHRFLGCGSGANRHQNNAQMLLYMDFKNPRLDTVNSPSNSLKDFLDFLTGALPKGDVYLFGGVLRDIALVGSKGFNSDVDLVVEGDWENCIPYLLTLGGNKNRFGGYRLNIGGWPVDIWNSTDTWAIKEKLVPYESIESLTKTTILNWDAILMNWRTSRFICKKDYLKNLNERIMDLVLEENPNPIGMAVRVFRHLCIKDAKKIAPSVISYLAKSTRKYTYQDVKDKEESSYEISVIDHDIYNFFRSIECDGVLDIKESYKHTVDIFSKKLIQNKLQAEIINAVEN